MSSQINAGSVRVENAIAIVRSVYEALLQNITGSPAFLAGEAITWGADGVGVVTTYDDITKQVNFYRTTGAFPAIGDNIDGPSGDGDIASFSVEKPDWVTDIPGGSQALFQATTASRYQVLDGGRTLDSLTLSVNFAEADDDESEYSVHIDFTPDWRLPLPAPGDVDAVGLVAAALSEVERRGLDRISTRSLAAPQTLGNGTWDTVLFDTTEDERGVWAQSGGVFRVIDGVVRVELKLAIKLDAAANLQLRILKDAASVYGLGEQDFGSVDGAQLVTPSLIVAAGEEFTVEAQVDSAGIDILSDDATWFQIRATRLS